MKIGIVGAGRMGKILAQRLSAEHKIVLFDSEGAILDAAEQALDIEPVTMLGYSAV